MIQLNEDGYSIKGCSIIYAPKGQAGEYSKLACNPYRGCGHKCSYCLDGDTLIQMSDGPTKKIRDVLIGESILGVTLSKNKRSWGTRIVNTKILAKVTSQKQSFKVTLEDKTIVICSADHRWLTERGWKYTASDNTKRPCLTVNNSIRKISNAVETLKETDSYKIGYIAGMVRGDGSIGIYDYSEKRRKSGKTMGVQHRFRLALKDDSALQRTKNFLSDFGVETNLSPFKSKNNNMKSIVTTSPSRVAKIKSLTEFQDNTEWQRGWLAGIFDAEGSHGKESIRIHNSNDDILTITKTALSNFNFSFVHEKHNSRSVDSIRILGGRLEKVRFWNLANPSIRRKFTLTGQAVSSSIRVTSVEPTNETIEMFDIMTGTENFIANGLVSHNCYVPRVLRMTRQEFDAKATPRKNFLINLIKDAKKYQQLGITEQVMMSFTTDPYHPSDNSLTREVIIALQNHGLGICTLTKGGKRALRDIDLFRPDQDAFASTLTSLNEDFSKKWERGAALPKDRIDTLKAFHEAGIFTWVSLEPTLDIESSLEIVQQTHEFVDLFKIGRVNYLPITKTTDWKTYTEKMLELVNKLNVKHYFKKDLQQYLPQGYYNPKHINQYRKG